MSEKLQIGQILYRYKRNEFVEYKIHKIGRKYFYCNNDNRYKIDKETLEYIHKDYSQANFQLHTNKQDIIDFIERNTLTYDIEKYFRKYDWHSDWTLDKIRQIHSQIGLSHE